MKQRLVLLLAWLVLPPALADELPGVLHWQSGRNLETVYKEVYNSLEENRMFVVFEPDIGANLAGFEARWGADYNRSRLGAIRSMVFCNAWYANQVSNLEPRLLGLCPLHITVYTQGDKTHVVFNRPTHTGAGSKAVELLQELEADVQRAVDAGIEAAEPNPDETRTPSAATATTTSATGYT